ncbi:hypothetical protein VKT23_020471 [Stygiomarasmius scandens]|uniref:Uncharacterized protein n=1 Tax=Marasmiellus scandens TaxID=2682957 RepID=A0ABR1ILT0_9AGAR
MRFSSWETDTVFLRILSLICPKLQAHYSTSNNSELEHALALIEAQKQLISSKTQLFNLQKAQSLLEAKLEAKDDEINELKRKLEEIKNTSTPGLGPASTTSTLPFTIPTLPPQLDHEDYPESWEEKKQDDCGETDGLAPSKRRGQPRKGSRGERWPMFQDEHGTNFEPDQWCSAKQIARNFVYGTLLNTPDFKFLRLTAGLWKVKLVVHRIFSDWKKRTYSTSKQPASVNDDNNDDNNDDDNDDDNDDNDNNDNDDDMPQPQLTPEPSQTQWLSEPTPVPSSEPLLELQPAHILREPAPQPQLTPEPSQTQWLFEPALQPQLTPEPSQTQRLSEPAPQPQPAHIPHEPAPQPQLTPEPSQTQRLSEPAPQPQPTPEPAPACTPQLPLLEPAHSSPLQEEMMQQDGDLVPSLHAETDGRNFEARPNQSVPQSATSQWDISMDIDSFSALTSNLFNMHGTPIQVTQHPLDSTITPVVPSPELSTPGSSSSIPSANDSHVSAPISQASGKKQRVTLRQVYLKEWKEKPENHSKSEKVFEQDWKALKAELERDLTKRTEWQQKQQSASKSERTKKSTGS